MEDLVESIPSLASIMQSINVNLMTLLLVAKRNETPHLPDEVWHAYMNDAVDDAVDKYFQDWGGLILWKTHQQILQQNDDGYH